MDTLDTEARIFTRYLIGRDVNPRTIKLYKSAMKGRTPNTSDQKLLSHMVSHPGSIGFIDAGLVFHDASSEARRRLYVLLAILEASPEYYDLFLSKNRSPLYVLVICFTGIRAIFKAMMGLILIKAVS
jgi:hypothetical protein